MEKNETPPKEKPTLKKNCRAQFLAVADAALAYIEQGYSLAALHQYYVAEGKISMTYQSWLKVIKNRDTKNPFGKQRRLPPLQSKNQSRSAAGLFESKKFEHSNVPTVTLNRKRDRQEDGQRGKLNLTFNTKDNY